MSICRVQKSSNYTVMSNHHLKNKELSLKAKGLLSVVLSLPDTWDYSVAGLVAICKENRTAVESALKELKDQGYLFIQKKTPAETDSGRFEYIYNFFEQPIKQEGEKQDLENLPLEILHLENHEQLNTKKENTKKENTKDNNMTQNNFLGSVNKKPKQSRWVKCVNMIDDFTTDEDVRKLLIRYLSLLNEMLDKPIYSNQWKGLLNKLKDLQTKGDIKDIINQSIERGYKSFYPVSSYSRSKSTFSQGSGLNSETVDTEQLEQDIATRAAQGQRVDF